MKTRPSRFSSITLTFRNLPSVFKNSAATAVCRHASWQNGVSAARFKLRFLFVCVVLSLGCASLFAQTLSGPVKHFPDPNTIRYDGHCFTIDGKDIFIRSAAFHYFRVPRELWRDRFQKIKDAGFNTVETYVPWNWHERQMPASLDDYSKVDLSEAEAWLKMAQDEFGFYTIVRPGPFICAEWAGGGYPRWLAKFAPSEGKDFWLRSADDTHIAWSVHWYNAVCKLFAREQITRKPKGGKGIIMVQIENEYDNFKGPDKGKVLRSLYDAVRNAGVTVPVFTCLTRECRESKDPELSQVFDCDNYYVGLTAAPSCALRMASLRASQPDAPGIVTELQGGWFSLVGGSLSEDHYSDARHYNAISLMSLLGGAAGLNTYMFVGGTHFGGWQARGQTTTYDYNAAIREWGALSPKYAVAEGVNQFIRENQEQLLRSEGGPCELRGAPANLFGGVRVAPDGTRFVFLDNTDARNPVSGKVTVVPGKTAMPTGPIYNLDQNGNRVLVKASAAAADGKTNIPPFEVSYDLGPLGAKVLVIPPGKTATQGVWYPKPQKAPEEPASLPAPVRLASALERNDPLDGNWQTLPAGKSLPELGVNDQRYVLYRARFSLTSDEAAKFSKLLINPYTHDLVFAQVNGQLAKRLYPSDAYAAAATRNTKTSFDRIRPDDFDNRFDTTGLLHAGNNEIVLLYENIGFEHGYIPMEQLSGIRQAGLSDNEHTLIDPLAWQVATDLGGVLAGWTEPNAPTTGWQKVSLDTTWPIPRKGNGIQPKGRQDALFTWYRLEFELPDTAVAISVPWRLLINASGNGFMWLNGHDIGRHWEIGPQREFYLPECWLNFGKGKRNVLVLGLAQTINGATIRAAEISPYPPQPKLDLAGGRK
ncbi:MAG TPA: beta-galactosidase [Chthoniobacterales bacterium]